MRQTALAASNDRATTLAGDRLTSSSEHADGMATKLASLPGAKLLEKRTYHAPAGEKPVVAIESSALYQPAWIMTHAPIFVGRLS